MAAIARIAALLVAFAFACGDDSAQGGPESGPAGEVARLTGEVHAERGEAAQARALAEGDVVHAEDVIVTADGASVTIVLHHNNAVWTLEGGKRRPVRGSAAWDAPRREGEALLADHHEDRTSAAGRHAERSAADTSSTALAPEPEAAEAEPAPEAEPAAEREAAEERPARAERRRRAKKRSSGKERAPKRTRTSDDGVAGAILGTEGDGDGTTGPGEGATESGGSGAGYGTGAGAIGDDAEPAPRLELGRPAVEGPLDRAIVRRVIRRHAGELRACVPDDVDDPATITLRLTIAEDGAVSTANAAGGAPAVDDCVAKRARRWRFPTPDGASVRVVQPLSYSVE